MEPREVHGRLVTQLSEVPWPCDVCDDGRDFDDISVTSREIRGAAGVEVTLNVRYCNDRPTCAAGAEQQADERVTAMGATLAQTFTCPACGMTSHNPNDVDAKYCGLCHWWTGVPELAAQRPELFGSQPGRIRGRRPDAVIVDDPLFCDRGRAGD